jgi:lipopolysaccharide export LptBFGC system permease protein LptF
MRISDRYIAWQIIKATFIAVLSISLILVIGRIFKEVRPLLVEQNVPPILVAKFVINALPVSLIYTVPWGFMVAVLLAFSRLSQEQEITALQLGGMSLPRIALPVFFLGAVLSGICVWVNTEIVPRSNKLITNISYQALKIDPTSAISPSVINSRFANLMIFVQEKNGNEIKGMHAYRFPDKKNNSHGEYIYAEKASIVVDHKREQIKLNLNSTYIEKKNAQDEIDIFMASAAPWRIGLEEQKKFRGNSATNSEIQQYVNNAKNAPIDKRKQSEILNLEIRMTQRYSFAMASLAFSCIAVPLGLKRRRKDSSSRIFTALLLGGAYFVFSLIGEQMKTIATASIVIWLPNLLFLLIGIILFYRAKFR